MKTEENKKTRQEMLVERINSLPTDPEWKGYNQSIPIPLGKGVLVKKIESQIKTITEAGILLAAGSNTPEPHLGIIEAVGPNCSEVIRPGLRCYFNFYVDSSFYHQGVHYWKMDESDIFYLVPPNIGLFESPKTESHVRRENKIEQQDSYRERKKIHDANEKDKKEESKKKKTTFALQYVAKKK
jgi:co-chaperonin GroES (HSP10)